MKFTINGCVNMVQAEIPRGRIPAAVILVRSVERDSNGVWVKKDCGRDTVKESFSSGSDTGSTEMLSVSGILTR